MDLAEALNLARAQAGGAGARANLAEVGKLLKREGVHLNGRKLSDVIRMSEAFGEVDGNYVTFGEGPPPQLDREEGGGSYRTLRSDLWRAMVGTDANTRPYMHVKTLQIVEAPLEEGEPGGEVGAASFAYYSIPRITVEEDEAFAREQLEAAVTEDALAFIFNGKPGWTQRARDVVDPDTWGAFWQARRARVIARAEEWLLRHQLPVDRFVKEHRVERRRATRPGRGDNGRRGVAAGSTSESRLRAHLHEAIDRMTLAELAELRIPARLLLDE